MHLEEKYKSDEDVKVLIRHWVEHSPPQTLSIFAEYLLQKSMKVQDQLNQLKQKQLHYGWNGNICTFPHPWHGDRHHFEEFHLDDEEKQWCNSRNIWFAYLGLGSFLTLTPLEPKEEKKLKTYAPDVYQTRYVHKKVVSSKLNNIYEIPSLKYLTLRNVLKVVVISCNYK